MKTELVALNEVMSGWRADWAGQCELFEDEGLSEKPLSSEPWRGDTTLLSRELLWGPWLRPDFTIGALVAWAIKRV